MIERTFPPLNIWWVRTQKFSSKLQAECSFTHPTNCVKNTQKTFKNDKNIRDLIKKKQKIHSKISTLPEI